MQNVERVTIRYNGQEGQRAARGSITLTGLQKTERAFLGRKKEQGQGKKGGWEEFVQRQPYLI